MQNPKKTTKIATKIDKKDKKDSKVAKQDASYYNAISGYSTYVQRNQYTHSNGVLSEFAFDFHNLRHKRLMFEHNQWFRTYINKPINYCTTQAPRFLKKSKNASILIKEVDEGLTKKWNQFQLTSALRKIMQTCRLFGWCLFVPLDPETIPKNMITPPWTIYTPEQATPDQWDSEDGRPIRWVIIYTTQNLCIKRTITEDECIFVDPHHTLDHRGIPVGEDIWDDLIDLLFINEAWKSFDQRLGNGFMFLGVPESLAKAEYDQLASNMSTLQSSMGMVVKVEDPSKMKVEWMGMGGKQVDFNVHIEKIEQSIITSLGFPKRWLFGDPAGAQLSSGKDMEQIEMGLFLLLNEYAEIIKGIIHWYGWTIPETILPSEFQGVAASLLIQMENQKVELLSKSEWLTLEEKRSIMGFETTPVIKAELQQQSQGQESGSEPGSDPGESSPKIESPMKSLKSESISHLERFKAFLNEIPIKELSESSGMSPTTLYNMKAKLNGQTNSKSESQTNPNESQPNKIVEIVMKEDSQIGPNVYKMNGKMLTATTLNYAGKSKPVKRPFQTLEKWYHSEVPKEFYLGVTKTDGHESRIPLEVLKDKSIGVVKINALNHLTQSLEGEVILNLDKADAILGNKNWIRSFISQKKPIPVSVAMWTNDKEDEKEFIEQDLDIRSFVATRYPRNPNTFIEDV